MANDQFTSKGKFAENAHQVAKIEVHRVNNGIVVCKWWEGYDKEAPADIIQRSPRSFIDAKEWLEGSGWLVEEISYDCIRAFECGINPVEEGRAK